MITVAELIEHLKTLPQDHPVVHQCYSEYRLMHKNGVTKELLGVYRNDGWVHDYRADKPSQWYVVFPGN